MHRTQAQRWRGVGVAAAVAASSCAYSARAHADELAQAGADEGIVAAGTRPMVATLGLGPSIGAASSGGAPDVTQFKLTQAFGYHFGGDGKGPALGLSMAEAFGEDVVRIQPGVKAWWDFAPIADVAFYAAPSVKVGYLGTFADGASSHAFNLQLGAEGRLVFADRGVAFLRPLTLDFAFNEDGFVMFYDIVLGGGVTF